MLLQFRTERTQNGHCKYLAIDTKAETYATESRSWISKETPIIKARDYKSILGQLEADNWTRLPNM